MIPLIAQGLLSLLQARTLPRPVLGNSSLPDAIPIVAQLTLINDMNLTDDWAEMFALTVTEGELYEAEIRDAAVIFASNLWREGQEDYDNATPPDYKAQLKGCWARRVDLFLKVARDLYPQECCGITVSDIEREVQAT